jgi:hypothetical protein
MKKYLVLLAVLAGVLTSGVASASLYDWYASQGLDLPTVSVRASLADSYGISNYKGTVEQNNILESFLRGGTLGIASLDVVALYEDNLQDTITASQTTLTLVRGTDKSGTALSGTFGFIIDEGTTLEEFVIGTASGTAVTGLQRGISVTDGKTEVTALKKAHRKGATIKMTNYPILGRLNRQLSGLESLDSFLYYTTSTILPTLDGQLATKYYVDQVGAGGFTCANVSSSLGLQCLGTSPEKVGINASSTTGSSFDASGKYYQAIGNALTYTNNAIAVSTSTIVSQIATSTPTASMIPIADGSGYVNSWINASTLTGTPPRLQKSFTAGENITAGQALVVGNAVNFLSGSANKTSGGTGSTISDTRWWAMQFRTSPSAKSIKSIGMCQQGGGASITYYTFTSPVTVSPDTLYFIVVRCSDASCNAGKVSIRANSGNLPTGSDIESKTAVVSETMNTWLYGATLSYTGAMTGQGGLSTNSGSSWSDSDDNLHSDNCSADWEIYELNSTAGQIYTSNATNNNEFANNFVGFAANSASSSQSVTVNLTGVDNTQTGLSAGYTYYLSNTSGAISTSAGSQSRKVGLAVSSTELLIKYDNP